MPSREKHVERCVRIITLDWQACKMDREYPEFEADAAKAGLPGGDTPLVYAFEGKHDAYPSAAVLYIGQTQSHGGGRPLDSAGGKGQRIYPYYPPPRPEQRLMWSCYSNMVLRWAEAPADLEFRRPAEVLERILIQAMKPAANCNYADAWFHGRRSACRFLDSRDPTDCGQCLGLCRRDLVVCNTGDKGLLLPVLYGNYFAVDESSPS
jgi:hypothetical protein